MFGIQWIWTALVLAAVCFLLQELFFMKKRKRLPPGPKGLPILGNLHMLGKNPHQDLCKLARKHGPIMHLRFGYVPAIVVSSPEAAEKFLKTYDQVFASRPYHEGSWYVSYEQRNLIFGPYGPYWRNMRKLCILQLLSNQKINSFQPMRRKEVGALVESLKTAASDSSVVDLSAAISSLGANIGCLMIFGKKYMDKDIDDRGFKDVVTEVMHVGALPNLGDFFPGLGVLDLQGITRRFKALSKVFDSFFERVIDEHEQSQEQKQTKDFVDIMLEIMHSGESEFEFDRRNIKAILLDMLITSMDTSVTAVEWAISDLLRHPECMRKLQKELGKKVGLDRIVEESDLENLEYLNMVLKESMRLHPVAPLLLPHESMEDCTVHGFHIPRKSRIIINVWAIGRDPNVWHNPESFIPERFKENNVDFRGQDFRLIPFGSGRRSCPGLQLGLTVFRFVLAQLVHCFDWKLADDIHPTELDMSEAFGLVTSRAQHLSGSTIQLIWNKKKKKNMMPPIWIHTVFVVLAISFLTVVMKKKNRNPLPPSPKGLPILGHLHLLGKNPHQDLHKLSNEHGPIMHLKFGFVSNIVVSTPHAAEQFLKTNDLVFASRPPHEAAKQISWGQRNLSFAKYGPYWRDMRKLCTLNLLSNLKISSFQSMRKQEIGFFVESLKRAAINREVVDISAEVAALNADMSCLMVLGKKYEDKEFDERGFKAVIKEGMQLTATPNLADYFPILGVLDLQGLKRRMKAIAKVFDGFFEKIIDEHEENPNHGDRQSDDFVYTMLHLMKSGESGFPFDRRHIKATLLDMLAGSMDTSATVVEWILSELLKHPQVMKKLQKELEEIVGLERMVEESDLDNMKYLDMVVKEAMRLHPVAPLLIPHASVQDCVVDGFHIPKDSRVIVNVWTIGRDPNAWSSPNEFIPERFVGSKLDVKGHDFQLLPFGSGRRGCPGMQLGLTVVRLLVAQLVHCFDWELPDKMLPEDLDMTEEFGLVVTRAKHLMAIPTYRLK
ncbi:OLC1v1009086C1 [Oldenlandia corymbosa var. corymbosa]|uniref:OLC1v1009086C1 n=1 Tax=Oldenlandia corymbosa var. corymbosa TaxID=529605 RepID=A0AAV1DQJ2_OLDCO|nr:OLC1v1009086C1 [Oldenlandia corymbosa var. corymbosa]